MSKNQLLVKARRKVYRSFKMFQEKLSGIDFTKGLTLEELGLTKEEGNIYAASASYDLRKVLKSLEIKTTDAILDLGCGKGAAMYEMSKFPFAKIAGVEINAEMCRVAENNFRQLKLTQLEVFQSDAGAFQELDGFNCFYLFNPFPEQVLVKVLENIQASFQRLPRKMVIVYYLPARQKLIEDHGFFKFSHTLEGEKYNTSVFTNQL